MSCETVLIHAVGGLRRGELAVTATGQHPIRRPVAIFGAAASTRFDCMLASCRAVHLFYVYRMMV